MSNSDLRLPDVVASPPDRYPHIANKFGVCGIQPTLRFNETTTRLHIDHTWEIVGQSETTADEYISSHASRLYDGDDLPPEGENDAVDDFRAAVQEALDYWREFEDELAFLYDNYSALCERELNS